MSVLRNLETKLADLVEGGFGRMFRAEVRPVELARRLAKEMDAHRTDVARAHLRPERVRRPSLAPATASATPAIEREVCEELSAYLLEHARAERLALASRPVIEFRTDERLGLGEFGIETHHGQDRRRGAAGARSPSPPRTGARWSSPPRSACRTSLPRRRPRGPAARSSTAEGKRFVIGPAGAARRAQPRLRRRARGLQRLAQPRAHRVRGRRQLDDRGPRTPPTA